MESNEQVEARLALESIAQERAETARHYSVPAGYDELLGLAVALLVLAIALGNSIEGWRGTAALAAGVVAALGTLGWQVARFRRANGMWVSGLVAGRTRVITAVAFVVEVLGIVLASVLADRGHAGWTVVIAVAAGAALAGLSRLWSRRYVTELGA